MTVYDLYRTTFTDNTTTALVVGHLRTTVLRPAPARRVPLFDDLTPALAAASPYPLYALATITDSHTSITGDPEWCLIPAEFTPNREPNPLPANLVRLHNAAYTPLCQARAPITEPIYAALHAAYGEMVPSLVEVYQRADTDRPRPA